MALSNKGLAVGLRVVGLKPKVLFSNPSPIATRISVAYISGRASRTEPVEKPKPWPYKERRYTNLMAYFDRTLKRIGDNSKVVVVEGLQGIGKSQLAKALAEELEMEYFPMATTNNYFVNYYGYDLRSIDSKLPARLRTYDELDFVKNPRPKTRKVIQLQVLLWQQKFIQYQDALAHLLNTGQGVVLDRCVYSDYVFADTLLEMGYIDSNERKVYQQIADRVMSFLMRPHLIIYLDAPISVVEDNLKKRGHGEEKVWNKEMLERLEHNYKHKYLKTISEHAELLAYDWSTPGDADAIVEDIERIDFDRFEIRDTKMEDWRLKETHDWDEKRWEFTSTQATRVEGRIYNTPFLNCPQLEISPQDQDLYDTHYYSIPGNKYRAGYNEDMGDTGILFRDSLKWRIWKDHGFYKPKTDATGKVMQ